MAVVLRMTLPCPTGQGTLWGRGAALLAPLGQGRFGRSRAGSWGFGVFAVDGSFRVHGNLLPAREKRWARWSCLSTSEQNHVSGGERRALPAPAQGTNPLRIPLAAAQKAFPHNESRAAPAPEPSGGLRSFFQSKTQQRTPVPFLPGQGFGRIYAAALAGGTTA